MGQNRITAKKAQSIIGFSVSIFFVGVGLFVLVPTVGAFGILWTLFALVICILNVKNAFPKKSMNRYQNTVEDNNLRNSAPARSLQPNPEERLLSLMELYDKGLIEKEEYEQKRKSIIEYL
ncbi:MAG: SHOCT domain-containing protein [Oscillospiraceae bacterium]